MTSVLKNPVGSYGKRQEEGSDEKALQWTANLFWNAKCRRLGIISTYVIATRTFVEGFITGCQGFRVDEVPRESCFLVRSLVPTQKSKAHRVVL